VGVINAGDFWHSDLSFSPTPRRVTFLQALEVAEEGSDTEVEYANGVRRATE
jgi:alpha-ketoglutarate-dependent taurine dioxygenase